MAPTVLLHLPVLLALLMSPAAPQTISPAVEDLIRKNADFGAQLYRAVASRTDDNIFLSPFAVSAGMLALLGGTSGPTQNQLIQGLGLTGLEPQTLPDVFQNLRNAVLQTTPPLNLLQGFAVFPDQSFQVPASFQDLLQMKYGGKAQSLPYTNPAEALDIISRWVQEQSNDQIKDVLTSLEDQTKLLVVSAASYKIRFNPPFNSSLTQSERFYVDKYHVIMVPMMFRADKYFLAYDRGVKAGVLKLPMADGAAMLVVLPDEDVDVTAVEEEVTAAKIRAWIAQLRKTKLEVQLPVFLLEQTYSLKNMLQRLEITQVFQDDADLSNMGGASGTKLTEVYHMAAVSMDESSGDGSSEGGVTTFSSPPPRLTFNRPFIFIIYQQSTNSLLFMGRVTNPTEK
ncbi:PREDICTED: protein Z-dependent protease inhibitor-like [Cyprinodon variegatus]|uniref:X-ray repair complementing defective repair in Chinese hamster cells 3 n=1 Tax=Cyprinodon variegatus TaxID=28743 RepID=A0A3Q2EBY9_CYPVA|nr:PREDICTED: protein Z-dependent protease inhibitor-like [Cyprinodon variegatus]XP_015251161.1 PREDICTED: protein Z-dependent protease inhibitor-like [Cyprinodon variegatus]